MKTDSVAIFAGVLAVGLLGWAAVNLATRRSFATAFAVFMMVAGLKVAAVVVIAARCGSFLSQHLAAVASALLLTSILEAFWLARRNGVVKVAA